MSLQKASQLCSASQVVVLRGKTGGVSSKLLYRSNNEKLQLLRPQTRVETPPTYVTEVLDKAGTTQLVSSFGGSISRILTGLRLDIKCIYWAVGF